MTFEEYVEMGLSEEYPVKLILKGYVLDNEQEKIGITEVVFITMDRDKAKVKFDQLTKENNSNAYYMVYSVPFDVDLTSLKHYPSIAISKADLK